MHVQVINQGDDNEKWTDHATITTSSLWLIKMYSWSEKYLHGDTISTSSLISTISIKVEIQWRPCLSRDVIDWPIPQCHKQEHPHTHTW